MFQNTLFYAKNACEVDITLPEKLVFSDVANLWFDLHPAN